MSRYPGLHEPADRSVGLTAGEDRDAGILLRPLEVVGNPLECAAVDHGAHEVAEVAHVSHTDVADHANQPVSQSRPEIVRDIGTGGSAALLPLIFVRATQ
jgi:hypothetical protein